MEAMPNLFAIELDFNVPKWTPAPPIVLSCGSKMV